MKNKLFEYLRNKILRKNFESLPRAKKLILQNLYSKQYVKNMKLFF